MKTIAKTVCVNRSFLNNKNTISRMFELFKLYYDVVDFEEFQRDLSNKSHVILLLDKNNKTIQGFSTLTRFDVSLNGKNIRGVFSGDTVIAQEYWGGMSLQLAFCKFMVLEKLKNPFQPLYWFLISKGYKTYLMLANNFDTYFPRYDLETPEMFKDIIDSFGRKFYPKNYCEQTGLIRFDDIHNHVKGGIAPIGLQELGNPKIKFFVEQNPTWHKGTELACVGDYHAFIPLKVFIKRSLRPIMKSLKIQKLANLIPMIRRDS